jgi:hypothetical protein
MSLTGKSERGKAADMPTSGAVFLFVIGGLLGLVALAVYNRGRRDATGHDSPQYPRDDTKRDNW